jgi:hypothetical protein
MIHLRRLLWGFPFTVIGIAALQGIVSFIRWQPFVVIGILFVVVIYTVGWGIVEVRTDRARRPLATQDRR